jgi:rhodanese-related sulfurtransferase
MRTLLLIATLALAACGTQAQTDRLDAPAFQERLKAKDVQLVDVRTPEEFATGHLEGAVNIDYVNGDFMAGTAVLDKTKPVLLYCAAGGRSESALGELKAAGFTQVQDLLGGINGWKKKGLPVAK